MSNIRRFNLHHRRQSIPTIAQALDRYITEISPSKKGAAAERSIARIWQSTRLGNRQIDRVRPADIADIRDDWLGKYAPATVVRRMALLSHLYTVLRKDWGHHDVVNPVQLVRRPAVRDARDRRLQERVKLRGMGVQEDELTWIIKATLSPELPTILILARETAMRRAEIAGLRREWINLRLGTAYLPDTKNGKSREVPLSPFAVEALRKWLESRPHRGRIFTLSPSAVTRAFIRAKQRARREYEALCRQKGRRPRKDYFHDLRFHDLRHEATSVLAEIYDMHELAKITGHSDTRMLLRYYHPRGSVLAKKLRRSSLGKRQLAALRDTVRSQNSTSL
ncbi:MAG: site-specific integrase [Oxalobacter sp.]|nr:MAG: site-specific integrase [Oxalobacter sp.]